MPGSDFYIEEMRASIEAAAERDRQHREREPDCAMCAGGIALAGGIHYMDYPPMLLDAPISQKSHAGWEKIIDELGELAKGQIAVVTSVHGHSPSLAFIDDYAFLPMEISTRDLEDRYGIEIKMLKGRQAAGEGFEMDFRKAMLADIRDYDDIPVPTQDDIEPPRGGHHHLIPGHPTRAKKGKGGRRGHR